MTVFEGSRVDVNRSTFTGNWAGVDDSSVGSTYVNTIFWKNNLPGGISTGARYEMDIGDAEGVTGSFIRGDVSDVRGVIDKAKNRLDADAPDPRFDAQFVPQAPEYANAGYRPAQASHARP
jgi:hypothetical protein